MKTPESLIPALDAGIIQEVVRPLMSGKEAQIYVVLAGGTECAAKVYKEATRRNFKHRAEYTEGRRSRNSRDQRAVSKRTRHGRKQDEASWRNTEVDMIYRLRDAGVRVPEPLNFIDGVLIMELVKDADGDPAPRLGDLQFEAKQAIEIYHHLLRETVRMLSVGVIHGDLSDFNVLMGADGPVVIDLPQALDAAGNQNARKFLLRDVENLHRFVRGYAPEHPTKHYAEEMWKLYEAGRLQGDTELLGDYRPPEVKADTGEVLGLIEEADRDEEDRRVARGEEPREAGPKPLRTVVDFTKDRPPARSPNRSQKPERPPKPERSPRPERSAKPERSARPGRTSKPDEQKPAARGRRGRSSDNAAREEQPPQRRSRNADDSASEAPARPRRRRRRRAAPQGASEGGGENRAAQGDARQSQPARSDAAPAGSADEAKPRSEGPRRRRRGRRPRASEDSREAKPTSETSRARPARPETKTPGAGGSAAPEGAKRPARKRRRRPRRTGTRDPD